MEPHEIASRLLGSARCRLSGAEIDLLERVASGDTHHEGEWQSRDEAREFAGIETQFAADLR